MKFFTKELYKKMQVDSEKEFEDFYKEFKKICEAYNRKYKEIE